MNDCSCIFLFGQSQRPKSEKSSSFGRTLKPKPNVVFLSLRTRHLEDKTSAEYFHLSNYRGGWNKHVGVQKLQNQLDFFHQFLLQIL